MIGNINSNINFEVSVVEPSLKKRSWKEIQDDKVKHRRTKSGRGILNYYKLVLPEREKNVESSDQIESEKTSSGSKCSNNTLDPNSTSPVEINKIKSGEGNGNFEEKIPKDSKWTLSTEKVIEDALYIFGIDRSCEHLSHSFIIDPDDKSYIQKGIFTHEEIDEIKNFNKKEFPLIPDDLLKYLNNFRKFNTADLRELIFCSDLCNQPFNRLKDFDYDWIRNTIYNLVLEYEANHLTKDHLEAWSFVDKAFLNIDGMKIVREELYSYALTTPLKRKLMGRCSDLIIQKWHTEYEARKIFEENNGTKIIHQETFRGFPDVKGGLKMSKMLRDMFNDLCEAMEIQESKIRKLETMGFIIADLPVGHIYRLLRTCLFKIPTQVCEFGTKAFLTISLIWKAKTIVKNIIRLMEEEDLTEEQQLLILQHCVEDDKGLRILPPL
ncbi:hypothetical protein Glove_131g62 [Diversispora epigaea]|uniref:Uncharacterized protein n=1 Tax=Diversispora epigaea TaxID=1348612 RepID=A0A397J1V2_9GLOM|nr:hypothetical protein Glove_131g62 [Diversispora epigaea]